MAAYQQIFFWYYDTPAALEVTSWTYPVEVVEKLDVGTAFGASSYFIQAPMDGLDVGLALVGGSLVNTLLSYTHPPEDNLNLTLAVTGGSLVNTLLSHAQPPEDFLDLGLAITSGILVNGLVSNTMQPEGVDVALALTSGTLV